MVCYQENDNIISDRSITRLEEMFNTTTQQQGAEEDTDSMPGLEWGSDYDVNPAEEDTNNDTTEDRWHYIAEEQNEEFYRRFGEEGYYDFFTVSSFELPDYIRRPTQAQSEAVEADIEQHEESTERVQYVNRRRPFLSNTLYENISNNLFLN